MCDLFTAIGTGLAIATSAVGVISSVQAANAQNAQITQTYDDQRLQIRHQESAELNDQLRQSRQEQARIKVAAGESGLQLGGSVQALLGDSLMQTQLAGERIDENAYDQQLTAADQANSAYSRITKPTLLGAGLQIASSGIGAYASASTRALSIKRASGS